LNPTHPDIWYCSPGAPGVTNTATLATHGAMSISSDGNVYIPFTAGSSLSSAQPCDTTITTNSNDQSENGLPQRVKTTDGHWNSASNLQLLVIHSDGSYSTQQLDANSASGTGMSVSGVAGFFGMGRSIPDGQGGALLTLSFPPALYHASTSATSKFPLSVTPPQVFDGFFDDGPVLLGQNGIAYIAGSSSDTSPVNTVAAIDTASGSAAWTYSAPQGSIDLAAATADGGATIRTSQHGLIQLDSSGSASQIATAQPFGLPSYSWHGTWYAPPDSRSGFASITLPLLENFSSLWANPRGDPSGRSKEGRTWYFALVWQNDFIFIPRNPKTLPDLQVDITNYAPIIKKAALKAFGDAYSFLPVTVFEGSANTGDAQALVMNHQNLSSHTYSAGVTPPKPNRGISPPTDFTNQISQIDYINLMYEAQFALSIVINNAQDEATALARADLIQAIGRSVGNTSAHEVAHQFLLQCCDMDSLPKDPSTSNPYPSQPDSDARGAYNAGGFSGKDDPSFWIGYWPNPRIDLHWENTPITSGPNAGTPNAVVGLENCLRDGWYKTPIFCSSVPFP